MKKSQALFLLFVFAFSFSLSVSTALLLDGYSPFEFFFAGAEAYWKVLLPGILISFAFGVWFGGKKAASKLEPEIAELEEMTNDMGKQLMALRGKNEKLLETITLLRGRIRGLEDEKEYLLSEIRNLEGKVGGLEKENRKLSRLADREWVVSVFRKKNEELKRRGKRIDELQKEVAFLRKELEKAQRDLCYRIKVLDRSTLVRYLKQRPDKRLIRKELR